jgi:hypothetical protein
LFRTNIRSSSDVRAHPMSDLPGFEEVYGEGPVGQGIEEKEPSFRLKAVNRNQLLLRPVDLEKLIPPDHEARAIWEFTGRIDLAAYYRDIKAVEGRAGSAAFDPRLLVSVWIYSYAKGIGSARETSRLCEYDPRLPVAHRLRANRLPHSFGLSVYP